MQRNRVESLRLSIQGSDPATAWQPLLPGVMGGGVNQFNSRGISAYPSKNFQNDPNNWTLIECAIYYNATPIFLAGYFGSFEGK